MTTLYVPAGRSPTSHTTLVLLQLSELVTQELLPIEIVVPVPLLRDRGLKDWGRLEFTYKYSHLSPAKVCRIKNTPDCVIDNSCNPTPRFYWLI